MSVTEDGDQPGAMTTLLMQLSIEFPELVFWKHLERGLSGEGDIDALAPPTVAWRVCLRYAELVAEASRDVKLVFACNHAFGVHPVFVVRDGRFPVLEQFDVSYGPVRMGLHWCDPARLPAHATLDTNGIRVLRPGAQAVVLLMLYGLERRGRPRFKAHDRSDIDKGLQTDIRGAHAFIDTVLPPLMRTVMHRWVEAGIPESIASDGLSDVPLAAAAWAACVRASAWQTALSLGRGLGAVWQRRVAALCEIRQVVHGHRRRVPNESIVPFIDRMSCTEQVLFRRDKQTSVVEEQQ